MRRENIAGHVQNSNIESILITNQSLLIRNRPISCHTHRHFFQIVYFRKYEFKNFVWQTAENQQE